MPDLQTAVQGLQSGADVLFLLTGAILVFAMHGGFAFLEAGTVRHKNQVNALCKILVDFAISTVAYFLVGYTIAYGVAFFVNAEALNGAAKGFEAMDMATLEALSSKPVLALAQFGKDRARVGARHAHRLLHLRVAGAQEGVRRLLRGERRRHGELASGP